MKIIQVDNLTRDYDHLRAVDSISFEVNVGEIFGFLGPNGAGKTTTIQMLTGLLQPTSGEAWVAGYNINKDRQQLHQHIGVVFEAHNLYERLSLRDNLLFSARLFGINPGRVDQVIEVLNLSEYARQRVRTLSHGTIQRVMIARATLHQPAVIFMDEPTKGLDPGHARMIRGLVRQLAEGGTTIFLSTHYMEEADTLCGRVAILDHGRIVALDTPAALKAQHGSATTTLEDVFITLTGHELYLQ
jgi:ABC-2 type transport system ATP-binding protein